MNWEADDPFGSPPRGPRDREYYPPREHDDVGVFGPDTFHPVEAGPADSDGYRVHRHEREFELRTTFDGDWPGLCTFSIDDRGYVILRMSKKGRPWEQGCKHPWGFLISKKERTEQSPSAYEPFSYRNPAGLQREWWTIKAVLKSSTSVLTLDDKYSHYTHNTPDWSAPVRAVPVARIEAFAQWARSRGYETVCDFC